jgi:hypothetical protein
MAAGSGSSSSKIDPTTLILAGASGSVDALSALINRKRTEQLSREQLQAQRDLQNQDVASKESLVDPFRQQMNQATDISALDRMERGAYTPVRPMSVPSRYAGTVPSFGGGFSYEKSPEMIASAGMLKRNVMGGNVAPSMTDPTNYGKTATLNLLRIASSGQDPGSVNGTAGAPANPTNYLNGMPTRDAGGLGAAETRGTDVSVAQAQQVLAKAIQTELGRPPNPGEIDQLLAAQGLKPGDRWVGNAGLTGLLSTIRQQASSMPQPSYSGRG